MAGLSEVEIRDYAAGDEAGIVALLNEVFSAEDPSFSPRTMEQWEWIYRDNPAGRQVVVAATPEGRIVAHYACIPYRVLVRGVERTCGQGVDSMVSPDFRRGLRTGGLFLATASRYFETYGSPGQNAFGYGFPNRAAYRIGVKRLGYRPVHAPLQTLGRNLWASGTDPAGPEPEGEVVAVDRFGAAADDLWRRVSSGLDIAICRDARYLQWRYLDCPFARHLVHALIGADGSWRGAYVARPDWTGPPILALSELLVPADDDAACTQLLAHAVGQARRLGQQRVEVWFPPRSRWFGLAVKGGFQAEPSPFNLCIKLYDPALASVDLGAAWFFSIGDADVF